MVGHVADREDAVGAQGLAAVANLAFKKGVSKPAGRGGQGRGGHRGQGRAIAGPSAGECFAYAEMEGMTSSWQT